jgi:5-methylcytosine-specific restriction endonuclease McrA
MKKTICTLCNREISNCNYRRHVESCDGTYFTGPHNPNKLLARRSTRSPEELKALRIEIINKARELLKGKVIWNKGLRKYSDEEIFCIKSSTDSRKFPVKQRFLEKFAYCCQMCNISNWNNSPLTLELDHINGNHCDDRLENLRLLCPNCHSQTDTYKNKKGSVKKVSNAKIISAIKSSKNIREVLLSVGLQDQGSNYRRVNKILEKYSLNLNEK